MNGISMGKGAKNKLKIVASSCGQDARVSFTFDLPR